MEKVGLISWISCWWDWRECHCFVVTLGNKVYRTFICVLRAWLLGSRTQITVPDVRPHGSLFRNLFLDSAASVSQEATIIGLHFFSYIVIFFCLCGNDLL